MPEETTATQTATGERSDPAVSLVVEEKQTLPENENVTESFFGETVSEAELRGEEGEIASDPPPTKKEEQPPAKETPPPKDEGAPPKGEKQAVTEEPKPPQGYVPLAALHEERGKRQALNQKIQQLEAELKSGKPAEGEQAPPQKEVIPQPKESALPPDFKVLTPQEYRELAETDVVEANLYLFNLDVYKDEQRREKDAAEKVQRVQDQISQIVEQRFTEMESIVPGILEENSEVNIALTDFAESHGLESLYLGVLTNPATRIVQPDGKVQILGKGAVQVLSLLNNLYQGIKADPSKIQQLKAEGAAEALKKITDKTAGYRSVGSTPPGGSSVPDDPNRMLSEAELEKLSPAEQERYLSGA